MRLFVGLVMLLSSVCCSAQPTRREEVVKMLNEQVREWRGLLDRVLEHGRQIPANSMNILGTHARRTVGVALPKIAGTMRKLSENVLYVDRPPYLYRIDDTGVTPIVPEDERHRMPQAEGRRDTVDVYGDIVAIGISGRGLFVYQIIHGPEQSYYRFIERLNERGMRYGLSGTFIRAYDREFGLRTLYRTDKEQGGTR